MTCLLCSSPVGSLLPSYCDLHGHKVRVAVATSSVKRVPRGAMTGKHCAFPECSNPAVMKYLCDGHHQQKKGGRALVPLQPVGASCKIRGCTAPYMAKGYCAKHYDRWRAGKNPAARSRKDPSIIEDMGDHLAVVLTGKWAEAEGAKALVSREDHALVVGKTWRMNADGYATGRDEENRHIGMHRVILGLKYGDPLQGDHINGDRLDNRRENLRACTQAQNAQNKKVWGSSGHRNVYQHSRTKVYRVSVRKNKKLHYGGRHKELDDAIEAARSLRERLFSHANEDRVASLTLDT
jgi:hypothetical protein